ncbi:MAG: nitroreductase family protein [Deltaproteobacteria bacterium]|nr:nitroreductase family protein [Deltaproteobacteria bacterium]
MKKLIALSLFMLALTGFALPPPAAAADGEKWNLPKPAAQGGKPLMEALAQRQTNRDFSDKPIPEQILSDLLWATWGINRPDGKHTAPTARNNREIVVFAALENGVWRYEPSDNALTKVLPDDTRSAFGGAPLTLIYAAPEKSEFSGFHVGSLYQNAGLFCASAGLANVVKITGRDALAGKLALPKGYKVFIVHSIGWPR